MFFLSLTLLQALFPFLQKGHESECHMIIFAEITQLPAYRFIQGMKLSLGMYKALKIQQTAIIQCTMSILYGMKPSCRADALLTGFICFLSPCLKRGLDAVPAAFWFHSCKMKSKDDSSNLEMQIHNSHMETI